MITSSNFVRLACCFFLIICGSPDIFGQSNRPVSDTTAPVVETVDFHSKLVGAALPYIVVLPESYHQKTASTTRYPVLYLLHGVNGLPQSWLDLGLTDQAAKGQMIFVMPTGRDSYYTDSAMVANDKFESYIIQELIADVDRRFRTIARREGRAIAGLSMGGYGAIKFAIKYPEYFSYAASMSGAFQVTGWRDSKQLPENIREMFVRIFGEGNHPAHDANDLIVLLKNLAEDKLNTMPYFYIVCGTEDPNIIGNRQLIDLIFKRKIRHEYRQLPGGHGGELWRQQLPEVIKIALERLTKAYETK